MNKTWWLIFLAVLIVPSLAAAQGSSAVPLTTVSVHTLGPERVGNLPPVIAATEQIQTEDVFQEPSR